jgi:ribosome-associated toxin RatA of RatAB toxin-antitoxin module
MLKENVKVEYDWVVKVMESSVNEVQMHSSAQLFNNLVNKWEFNLTSNEKSNLLINFNKLIKLKRKLLKSSAH